MTHNRTALSGPRRVPHPPGPPVPDPLESEAALLGAGFSGVTAAMRRVEARPAVAPVDLDRVVPGERGTHHRASH